MPLKICYNVLKVTSNLVKEKEGGSIMRMNTVEITNKNFETYPLWDKITVDVMKSEKINSFRDKKKKEGYEVLSANQLAKDNIVYWLMFDEHFNCWLQEYGKIVA